VNLVDKQDFFDALAPLFAAFGKKLDPDQADAYWRFLQDQPLASVLDGIEAAGRKAGRYLPSVGQIRECIESASVATTPRDTRHYGDTQCEVCDDTGWEPCTDRAGNRAVRPCTCPRGAFKRGGRNLRGAA
jgi:hypothetical protein